MYGLCGLGDDETSSMMLLLYLMIMMGNAEAARHHASKLVLGGGGGIGRSFHLLYNVHAGVVFYSNAFVERVCVLACI